jgi:F-type H+-transporting ATPase subunit b
LNVCSIAKPPEIPTVLFPPAFHTSLSRHACERFHKLRVARSILMGIASVATLVVLAPQVHAQAHEPAARQPATQTDHAAPSRGTAESTEQQPASHGTAPQATASTGAPEHGEAESHAQSPWALVASWVNFLLLAGGLFYVLRHPLRRYLAGRRETIRAELVTARETATKAAEQLAELDRRLKELPGEIAALKARGEEEIAAEQARIQQLAEAERTRLLEQTRREIDVQVRLAKRELAEHAAALAVSLAKDRIEHTVTPTDQERLIDRYIARVATKHD